MKKYRKGVFFVVYSKTRTGKVEYLLLKRKLHWSGWEFPKGGIEKNEDQLGAVKRELKEEVGLTPLKIKKFNIKGKFKYRDKIEGREGIIGQTFESLYAVEVKKSGVKVDGIEHSDYRWLNFSGALKKLTWKNQKESLKIANTWLEDIRKIKPREIILSSGASVFIGKSDLDNERLVNYFIDKENTILHTLSPGSPFGVINKINPSEKEIYISGAAVASYSQDWRDNQSDIFVQQFTGKDIRKNKRMKLGTFGVRKPKTIKVKKKDIQKFKDGK